MPCTPDDGSVCEQVPSKELTEALEALLRPLHLNHGLKFDMHQDPGKVHISRRRDGLHRQELCFIRVEEAPRPTPPKKPPTNVRVGGGFYIPEVERAAIAGLSAAAQAAAAERHQRRRQKEQNLQVPSSAEASMVASPRSAQRRLSEALAAGSDHDEVCSSDGTGSSSREIADNQAEPYYYGNYTRGESRSVYGDRRQCPGKACYDDGSRSASGGDAAFRVLSNDRRCPTMPRPSALDSKLCKQGPGGKALGSLLSALGLEVPVASQEVSAPEVFRSECRVGGRWQVELCYVCADQTTFKTVEKTVEVDRIVEKPVYIPIEAPKPSQKTASCQASEELCSICGGRDHKAQYCPMRQLQEELKKALRCQLCGSPDHVASECHLRPPAEPERCQICRSASHLAPDCRLRHQDLRPVCSSIGIQTDMVCQLCNLSGHAAPECPLFLQLLDRHGGGRPMPVRVGGGWLIGPEVPGLSEDNLNEAEALSALASAKVATYLASDARTQNHGHARSARPRSAPRNASPSRPTSPHTEQQNCFIAAESMSPTRYKLLEKERAALSQRVQEGRHDPASRGVGGYLVGTYVQGSKIQCSSARGPRSGFRVLRNRITNDAVATLPTSKPRPPECSQSDGEEDASDQDEPSLCSCISSNCGCNTCKWTSGKPCPPQIKVFAPGSVPPGKTLLESMRTQPNKQ